MKNKATLFGGGFKDNTSLEYNETIKIGQLLANKGYTVISGGYYGMMEAVSKGSTSIGGEAIGITCKTFPSTIGNEYLTDTIIADDIFDRLRYLINTSSLFIIQKGGIGTLSEFFLLWDIIRKKSNPPMIYLIGDYWRYIIKSIENVTNSKENSLIRIVNNYNELEKELND